ncbi:hypothetical protein AGR1C_Lc80208 [Agrobacterium fabacearum TT111]|nr:hypothetical protein AGR1C_Lc80208 [Agrobacterium fabacearum TT111]
MTGFKTLFITSPSLVYRHVTNRWKNRTGSICACQIVSPPGGAVSCPYLYPKAPQEEISSYY